MRPRKVKEESDKELAARTKIEKAKAAALFPNMESNETTSTSLFFDIHYAESGVISRWTPDRYKRLCVFLSLTESELASLICLPHSTMRKYMSQQQFAGPCCLLLTIIEHRFKAHHGDTIKEPLPKFPANAQPRDP